jgi:hypothetical protein
MLHTPPLQNAPNTPLTVEGSLVNGGSVDRVVIRYRGPAEDYVELPMEFKYGDLYRGVIPAARMIPPGVEYYLEGITTAGQRIPLFMTAGKPARVFVMAPKSEDAGTPDAGVAAPHAKKR